MTTKRHLLRLFPGLFFILTFLMNGSSAQAAKQSAPPAATAAAPAAPAAPAEGVESEKAKSWKGLQAQEQWVARLKKQIAGEAKQLSEMRAKVAEKFKLDPKKLEAGEYAYDEKKDLFVDTTAS